MIVVSIFGVVFCIVVLNFVMVLWSVLMRKLVSDWSICFDDVLVG